MAVDGRERTLVGISRRFFFANAAAFVGCSAVVSPALAHGRKAKGHHGKTPAHAHARGRHAATTAALPAADLQTASAAAPAARADVPTRLDPQGLIRKPLLAAALVALERHGDRITDKSRIFLADFAKHSSEPRFYALDMTTGEAKVFRTAHGRGSDPDRSGWARRFSNQPSSYASSLGAYVTLGEAYGLRHGTHVGLDGLDPSNSNARDRAIIVHSADYCEIPFLHAFGMLGRSEGCFATSSKELRQLMPELGQGRLLYAGV
jgi:hypothetical protein